ncbi:hypothetical protein ACFL6L_00595 [candidate division KSB1 bacterium]
MKSDITAIILIFTVLGCFCLCSNPASPGDDQILFGIFLLNDPASGISEADDTPLEKLELHQTPWLSLDNIDKYDLNTHTIYVNDIWLTENDSLLLSKYSHGSPFVVVAGNERIYLGTFWWFWSSDLCKWPHFYSDPPGGITENRIRIFHSQISPVDVRLDPRIFRVLARHGKIY